MVRDVCADVLLGLAVAVVFGASLGVLLMRDAYQKLHFVTPAALVAPVLVALAVLVQMGLYREHRGNLPGSVPHGDRRAVPLPRHHAGHPGAGRRVTGGQAGTPRRPGKRKTMSILAAPYPVHRADGHDGRAADHLLVLVAAGATAVVLIRVPVRQVLMLSVYGVLLAVLFLAFQAPDVTLSELTVGAVVLPSSCC